MSKCKNCVYYYATCNGDCKGVIPCKTYAPIEHHKINTVKRAYAHSKDFILTLFGFHKYVVIIDFFYGVKILENQIIKIFYAHPKTDLKKKLNRFCHKHELIISGDTHIIFEQI